MREPHSERQMKIWASSMRVAICNMLAAWLLGLGNSGFAQETLGYE